MTSQGRSPEEIMGGLTSEMDAYLQYQVDHSDPNDRDPALNYRNAAVFQSYVEGLYGEEIWETLLDEITKKPGYKKYFDCIPAGTAFNRKGLEDRTEIGVYDHLHPAVENQLLSVVESAIQEEFRHLGYSYDTETYSQFRMGDRGSMVLPNLVAIQVLNSDGKSLNPTYRIASVRQDHEHAAFYKFGGLLGRGGVSFWLTMQLPDKNGSGDGSVDCKMIDCLDNPYAGGQHSVLGTGEQSGWISSIGAMLACAKIAVHESIITGSKNLAKYCGMSGH